MKESGNLSDFHEKYIKGTIKASVVEDKVLYLIDLATEIIDVGLFRSAYMYITTRSLKHMYDKRTAEEYDYLLINIPEIIRSPDVIYSNGPDKRANFCFVKEIDGLLYLCAIEKKVEGGISENFVVTGFRITKTKNYFKNYSPIWSRESGYLHRTDQIRPQ